MEEVEEPQKESNSGFDRRDFEELATRMIENARKDKRLKIYFRIFLALITVGLYLYTGKGEVFFLLAMGFAL